MATTRRRTKSRTRLRLIRTAEKPAARGEASAPSSPDPAKSADPPIWAPNSPENHPKNRPKNVDFGGGDFGVNLGPKSGPKTPILGGVLGARFRGSGGERGAPQGRPRNLAKLVVFLARKFPKKTALFPAAVLISL